VLRGLRLLLVTCVVAGVTAGFAAGAAPQTFQLLGDFDARCDGSGVGGTPGHYGFARFYAPSNTTIKAIVQITQEPNTPFEVELIQGDSDCNTVDATVMTDSQGRASVRVSEPITSSHALINVYNTITGTEENTQTYWH
jgi:hypothetical protein